MSMSREAAYARKREQFLARRGEAPTGPAHVVGLSDEQPEFAAAWQRSRAEEHEQMERAHDPEVAKRFAGAQDSGMVPSGFSTSTGFDEDREVAELRARARAQAEQEVHARMLAEQADQPPPMIPHTQHCHAPRAPYGVDRDTRLRNPQDPPYETNPPYGHRDPSVREAPQMAARRADPWGSDSPPRVPRAMRRQAAPQAQTGFGGPLQTPAPTQQTRTVNSTTKNSGGAWFSHAGASENAGAAQFSKIGDHSRPAPGAAPNSAMMAAGGTQRRGPAGGATSATTERRDIFGNLQPSRAARQKGGAETQVYRGPIAHDYERPVRIAAPERQAQYEPEFERDATAHPAVSHSHGVSRSQAGRVEAPPSDAELDAMRARLAELQREEREHNENVSATEANARTYHDKAAYGRMAGGDPLAAFDSHAAPVAQHPPAPVRGPAENSFFTGGAQPERQVAHGRRVGAQSSNVFATGSNQNAGNFITDVRTTRVLAPPGGRSTLALG